MKRKFLSAAVCSLIALAVVLLSGCRTQEPLSLWNENAPAKNALSDYIRTVTDKGSPDFIPVENRIAVFDFDGTLFLETDPTYFDWQLFEHRVLEDPSYKATDEQLAAARASREGKFPKLDKNRERMVAEAPVAPTTAAPAVTTAAFRMNSRRFIVDSSFLFSRTCPLRMPL